MRRSVRSWVASFGVLVGLVGAATLLVSVPAVDAVEAVPVDWVQVPGESWDRDLGCSLAVRSGSQHGSPAFALQTGSFGFFTDPAVPVVVDSILLNAGTSGATFWRDGGVNVAVGGGGCPGVAAAGEFGVNVMQWGDKKGLFAWRNTDAGLEFDDVELILPGAMRDFSTQVAVDTDGTIAIASANGDGVTVIDPRSNGWGQVFLWVPRISAFEEGPVRVALSDGLLAVARYPGDRVWVYSLEDFWMDPIPVQEYVVGAVSWMDGFGYSIDLDGSRIVVGAPSNVAGAGGIGAVYVITAEGGQWRSTRLVQSDGGSDDGFGESVAIDGATIAVGAPKDDDRGYNSGSVYVYSFDGSSWVERKLDGVSGEERHFGAAVALEDQLVAVGAPGPAPGSGSGGAGGMWVATIEERVPHPIGLVDPQTGIWRVAAGDGAVETFYYGNPGDVPFVGDWNCTGVDTPGLYRQSDGYVYLRNSNTQGVADIKFYFGNPGDVPVAGDWNGDGCDTVSLYRPSEQQFYIINTLGSNDKGLGAADFSFMFGNPGDKPVVGDWDGDGMAEVGLHRESTGLFYWRNTLTTGVADGTIYFGNPGDRFVAGDWGVVDGRDTPAVFRPANSTFYFRHTLTQGIADSQITWGRETWLPVAGKFR